MVLLGRGGCVRAELQTCDQQCKTAIQLSHESERTYAQAVNAQQQHAQRPAAAQQVVTTTAQPGAQQQVARVVQVVRQPVAVTVTSAQPVMLQAAPGQSTSSMITHAAYQQINRQAQQAQQAQVVHVMQAAQIQQAARFQQAQAQAQALQQAQAQHMAMAMMRQQANAAAAQAQAQVECWHTQHGRVPSTNGCSQHCCVVLV